MWIWSCYVALRQSVRAAPWRHGHRRGELMRHQIVLGTLVMTLAAAPAFAQSSGTSGAAFRDARAMFATPFLPAATMRAAASTQATPAPKRVTVVTGSDAPSLYIFRGLVQETDANFTFQPFVDV